MRCAISIRAATAITVEVTGFRKLLREGVVLQVGTQATLNLQMQTGEVSEAITVREDIAQLQTETADPRTGDRRDACAQYTAAGTERVRYRLVGAGCADCGIGDADCAPSTSREALRWSSMADVAVRTTPRWTV
jgi:hypothetical protein